MDTFFGVVLLWAAANGSPEAADAIRQVYRDPVHKVEVQKASKQDEQTVVGHVTDNEFIPPR